MLTLAVQQAQRNLANFSRVLASCGFACLALLLMLSVALQQAQRNLANCSRRLANCVFTWSALLLMLIVAALHVQRMSKIRGRRQGWSPLDPAAPSRWGRARQ